MSVYLDTNVLVALFVTDALTDKADAALRNLHDDILVSDLSSAEFASAIALQTRTRVLDSKSAASAFATFDEWCERYAKSIEIEHRDLASATRLLRRLDLTLRTPDAIHIAIAQRIGARLLTFDRKMAAAARTAGAALVEERGK